MQFAGHQEAAELDDQKHSWGDQAAAELDDQLRSWGDQAADRLQTHHPTDVLRLDPAERAVVRAALVRL